MPVARSTSQQLLRSAAALQSVADYSRRLAAHTDHLPVANASTADVLLNLQTLTDDMDTAANSLRGQCQTCLEGVAAVSGMSCPDSVMDELMNRLFSGDQDAAAPPTVTSMSSADALATSTYLNKLIAPCRSEGGTEHVVSQHAEIDAITPMVTQSSRSVSHMQDEETSLLRQLSLEGAGTEATFKRCRAPLPVVVATPVADAGRWMRSCASQ